MRDSDRKPKFSAREAAYITYKNLKSNNTNMIACPREDREFESGMT